MSPNPTEREHCLPALLDFCRRLLRTTRPFAAKPVIISRGDHLTMSDTDEPSDDRAAAHSATTLVGSRNVLHSVTTHFVYSICTMVTDFAGYNEMCRTFSESGFVPDDCEYLFIDNTSRNTLDGFAGVNCFLNNAKGCYIILCHQDVRIVYDDRRKLDALIEKINHDDQSWGVLGNSGGIGPGRHAVRITDPHGVDQNKGDLPARVSSLDENFVVVRRAANLAVSHDLSGFHLYATDLCIIANILGWNAYVIDFHLHHLSVGVKGASFSPLRLNMIRQYKRKLSDRLIGTPTTIMYLSNSSAKSAFMNLHRVTRLLEMLSRYLNRRADRRPN